MNRRISGFCTVGLLSALALSPRAQDSGSSGVALSATGMTGLMGQTISRDAKRRLCFDEQDPETGKEREEAAIAKLPRHYRYWLIEDAAYIITPEERCAYLQLSSTEEWDQFIDQFWIRRSPDPESLQNEYQEEHYRRIVFANENFSTTAGWTNDRGHAYIQFGPPDKIELHGSGEPGEKSLEQGPAAVGYPYEVWRYRYLEGIGENIALKFVDVTGSGNYRLTAWPEVKNESVFERRQPSSDSAIGDQRTEPERRLEVYVGPMPAGKVDFKDLEAMAVSHIVREEVSFRYESEYRKATHATTMAKLVIIISSDQLEPSGTDGESTAAGFEIFGRLSKASRVASTFEFSEAGDAWRTDAAFASGQITVPLEPGVYRLVLVVKDIGSGRTGTQDTSVRVPTFEELAANR